MRLRVRPPNAPPFDREADEATISIGRLEGDITTADPMMSRRHARLMRRGTDWFVEDVGSRNGTMLNGSVVSAPARVGPGDLLQLGGTRIEIDPPEPPAVPPPALAPVAGTLFTSASALAERLERPAPGAARARQAERLQVLNEFHRALAEPITLEALLDRLLARLCEALRAEEAVVLLKDPSGRFAPAASRLASAQAGAPVVSSRLVEEVAINGNAALVSDVALDPRFSQAHSIVASGIRSIAAVPLADAQGSLGMIALYARAHVRGFVEEDLELLASLATAAALRIRNVALSQHEAERQATEREMALARNIQMSLLPRELPETSAVKIAAAMRPARAVGGDLYDFFLDGDRLWFIVADAAGKGVSAALYMAMTRTLFRSVTRDLSSPGAVVARMNRELARDNEQQFFVTAIVGRLDTVDGTLTFANAGHPRPMATGRRSPPAEIATPETGMALGIFEEETYTEARIVFQEGDGLVLFTDGVTEAPDADGTLFDAEGIRGALTRALANADASDLVQAVLTAVDDFARGVPPHDDVTVVAVVFHGG